MIFHELPITGAYLIDIERKTDERGFFARVLNLSDAQHSLLDIADRSGLAFCAVRRAADLLLKHELLVDGP